MAKRTADVLTPRDVAVEAQRVEVEHGGGIEAAARQACLAALLCDGHPVLLGHALDDQAETALLGLLRDSGIRSLVDISARRGPFLRPLLRIRRAETEATYRR